MSNIKITLQDVSNTASQLRSINGQLNDLLSNIKNTMNNLNACWSSSASDEIIARFNKFSLKFVEQSSTIESYAKFLDYTVSSYDSLETTLTANASSFN